MRVGVRESELMMRCILWKQNRRGLVWTDSGCIPYMAGRVRCSYRAWHSMAGSGFLWSRFGIPGTMTAAGNHNIGFSLSGGAKVMMMSCVFCLSRLFIVYVPVGVFSLLFVWYQWTLLRGDRIWSGRQILKQRDVCDRGDKHALWTLISMDLITFTGIAGR